MSRRAPPVLLALALGLLAPSGIGPRDRFTWVLEVAPVLIALPILVATRRRFPLTALSYRLVFLHACILMLGGHYTYAEVPLGFWAREPESAAYEIVEWWAALATGEAATAFLGTQGDPWDTQWDMFLALVGALAAQLTLARAQDRELAGSGGRPAGEARRGGGRSHR
jgi:putative membrane protein